MLQSVVMFDTLNSDFYITYVLKHISGSWEKVPVHGQAEQGVGMLLDYKMLPSDKLQVKVRTPAYDGYSLYVYVGDSDTTLRAARASPRLSVWLLSYRAMSPGTHHQ